MSTIFHRLDRAYCLNAGSSALEVGQLYCIRAVKMSRSGEQTLNLVGHGDDWYNSCRFARVADPASRRWPSAK